VEDIVVVVVVQTVVPIEKAVPAVGNDPVVLGVVEVQEVPS